jgi:hypothetical protein
MAASTSFDEIKAILADLATRQQKFQEEFNMERLSREQERLLREQERLEAIPNESCIAALFRNTTKSLVRIVMSDESGMGCGFICSSKGHVLTITLFIYEDSICF